MGSATCTEPGLQSSNLRLGLGKQETGNSLVLLRGHHFILTALAKAAMTSASIFFPSVMTCRHCSHHVVASLLGHRPSPVCSTFFSVCSTCFSVCSACFSVCSTCISVCSTYFSVCYTFFSARSTCFSIQSAKHGGLATVMDRQPGCVLL